MNVSDDHNLIFTITLIIASVISSVFSLGNILLIRSMRVWNGHIAMILSIAVSQLIFDVSFAPSTINTPYIYLLNTSIFLNFFGGISNALYSNLLAVIVLFVIRYKETINILRLLKWYSLVICTISCIIPTIYFIYDVDYPGEESVLLNLAYGYFYFRLASIALNFFACGWTYYLVFKINRKSSHSRTIQEEAISVLSMRMLYYPFIQAISRAGLSWFEYVYGFDFTPTNVTPIEFTAQIVLSVTTPAASIGYFIIFLIMQPHAYDSLKRMCSCYTFKEEKSSTQPSPSHTEGNSDRSQADVSTPLNNRLRYNDERYTMLYYSDQELWNIVNNGAHGSSDFVGSVVTDNSSSRGHYSNQRASTIELSAADSFGNSNPLRMS